MLANAMGRPLPSIQAHQILPTPPSTVTCKSFWFLIYILPRFVHENICVKINLIAFILASVSRGLSKTSYDRNLLNQSLYYMGSVEVLNVI